MLTDAALKALRPTGKLYKVADRDGMYVAVGPSGTLSFRFDYRLNGRRETVVSASTGLQVSPLPAHARSASMRAERSARAGRRQLKSNATSAASKMPNGLGSLASGG